MEVCGDLLLEAESSGQCSSGSEVALYDSDEGEVGTASVDNFSLGAITLRNFSNVGIDAEKTRRISLCRDLISDKNASLACPSRLSISAKCC